MILNQLRLLFVGFPPKITKFAIREKFARLHFTLLSATYHSLDDWTLYLSIKFIIVRSLAYSIPPFASWLFFFQHHIFLPEWYWWAFHSEWSREKGKRREQSRSSLSLPCLDSLHPSVSRLWCTFPSHSLPSPHPIPALYYYWLSYGRNSFRCLSISTFHRTSANFLPVSLTSSRSINRAYWVMRVLFLSSPPSRGNYYDERCMRERGQANEPPDWRRGGEEGGGGIRQRYRMFLPQSVSSRH